jgi:hypothetical protein
VSSLAFEESEIVAVPTELLEPKLKVQTTGDLREGLVGLGAAIAMPDALAKIAAAVKAATILLRLMLLSPLSTSVVGCVAQPPFFLEDNF